MEGPMSDPAVVSALRDIYPSPEWLVLPEVRSGTGFCEEVRYADALAINLWPSSSDRLIGFEFKVASSHRAARADLRRELERPEKAHTIGRFCSRWYIVVRAPWKLAVFSLDELPEGIGLIEIGTGKPAIVRESERRDADPMSEALVLSLLRSAATMALEDGAPKRGVKLLTRDKIILRCGHEIPRALVKRPGLALPCYECAPAPLDAEALLGHVEENLREEAERFPDEAEAIVIAGGVAIDGVRASLRAVAEARS